MSHYRRARLDTSRGIKSSSCWAVNFYFIFIWFHFIDGYNCRFITSRESSRSCFHLLILNSVSKDWRWCSKSIKRGGHEVQKANAWFFFYFSWNYNSTPILLLFTFIPTYLYKTMPYPNVSCYKPPSFLSFLIVINCSYHIVNWLWFSHRWARDCAFLCSRNRRRLLNITLIQQLAFIPT